MWHHSDDKAKHKLYIHVFIEFFNISGIDRYMKMNDTNDEYDKHRKMFLTMWKYTK